MKQIFLITFIELMSPVISWAQQNLVPNYSFENLTPCPTTGAQSIHYASPWFQPNYYSGNPGGSTDIFNNCIIDANYSTPNNMLNFQIPKTGNSYAGITVLENIYADSLNQREYLEVQLSDTLNALSKYCIKYFVSNANVLESSYVIQNIDCFISNDSLLNNSSTYEIINVVPKVFGNSIIYDTINWQEINGNYLAAGGEKFITVGNFSGFFELNYDVFTYDSNGFIFPAYYFIDDVSVYELPDFNAGIDTTICPWDTTVIGPQTIRADVQYSWSPVTGLDNPNIANPLASPLSDITYVLTVTDTCQWACNSILTDTINISVNGCLGIEEIENKIKSRFVPNPASTSCVYEVELEINQSGKVEIYNINGELIQTLKLSEGFNRLDIDLSPFQNGVYVFKIVIDDELMETKRFVITK